MCSAPSARANVSASGLDGLIGMYANRGFGAPGAQHPGHPEHRLDPAAPIAGEVDRVVPQHRVAELRVGCARARSRARRAGPRARTRVPSRASCRRGSRTAGPPRSRAIATRSGASSKNRRESSHHSAKSRSVSCSRDVLGVARAEIVDPVVDAALPAESPLDRGVLDQVRHLDREQRVARAGPARRGSRRSGGAARARAPGRGGADRRGAPCGRARGA